MNFNFQNIFKEVLEEGKRDEMLSVYLPFFQNKGINMNLSLLKQLLLKKFVNEGEFGALSLGSNFYLAGVARYYFNGDLTLNKKLGIFKIVTNEENGEITSSPDKFNILLCKKLNALIRILRNSYIDSVGEKWEQPEDFGTLSIEKLLKKYNKKIEAIINPVQKNIEEPEEQKYNHNCGDYTYEVLYNPEDAKKYNEYTKPGAWCITYPDTNKWFNKYIFWRNIHYVIFRKNGFESVPRVPQRDMWKGNKPQDTYGNSLIAVLQKNDSPEPDYITSRWNHGNEDTSDVEADHAYTTEEFLNVIGSDYSVLQRCYNEWLENKGKKSKKKKKESTVNKTELLRTLKYAQILINGGKDPKEVFDEINYGHNYCDFIHVAGNEKGHKGTYLVEFFFEGEYYYTLMDRRIILFKDFITVGPSYGNPLRKVTKTYAVFEKTTENSNRPIKIYDLIHHCMLTIDGERQFKYYSEELVQNNDDGRYHVIGNSSSKWHFFNSETMKPIRTPRGEATFTAVKPIDSYRDSMIDYSGHIIMNNIQEADTKFSITTENDEHYVFDTAINGFMDTSFIPDGFKAMVSRDQNILSKFNLMAFEKRVGYRHEYMLYHTDTKTLFSIDNVNPLITKQLSVYKGIISFILNGESDKEIVYNLLLNVIVKFPPIRDTNFYSVQTAQNCFLIIRLYNNRNLLYNPYTNSFYHNNIDGYEFKYALPYNGYAKVQISDDTTSDEITNAGYKISYYKIPFDKDKNYNEPSNEAMPAINEENNIAKAKGVHNNEFYTKLTNVSKELQYYTNFLRDKKVYCNCDSPKSNFVSYLLQNFNSIGLKALIATSIDGDFLIKTRKTQKYKKIKNGDFLGEYCTDLMNQCDVIITNPPFDKACNFILNMISAGKDFLIVAPLHVFTNTGVFNAFKSGAINFGYTKINYFDTPNGDMAKFGNTYWLTSFNIQKDIPELPLTEKFETGKYEFVYGDILMVNSLKEIPCDYNGEIAVPLTILPKLNRKQFKLGILFRSTRITNARKSFLRVTVKLNNKG